MHKLLKNISLYSFGDVLNKSIQFLLLPLYANYLIPEDYGKLELTYLFGAILVIFYGLIIENGYSRLYFDNKDKLYRDNLFGSAFFFKLLAGAFFLCISLAYSNDIATLLFDFENGSIYIQLISISIFLKSLSEIPLKTLIVEKRAIRFVINNFLYVLVSLSTTVYFIVVLDLNIKGVLYGQILGASVQLVTLLFSEWKWSYIHFSPVYIRGMLYFSIFLIPSQLASFVTYWSNRLFLQEYASLDNVGTFSFGYKIASIIPVLLTGPIKKAVGPVIYELISNPSECKKKIRQFTLIILFFLSSFALILSTFAKEIIMLMGSSNAFISSYKVVFILSLGYVVIGMAGIVVLPINISKKTWLITITWVLSSGLNLFLNYYLVPRFGNSGASYATLLTFVFIILLYFISAELVYKVNFEYGKYLIIMIITIVCYYFSTFINTNSIIIDVIFKILIVIFASFTLLRLVFSKEDRQGIFFFVKSKFSILKN